MKVSVIVPVYNVYNYLEKCLESLVNQTLKDIEIIVVNDGSPDNSEEIIKKYAKKYKNIKALKKENGGLSSARNFGYKHAKGEYIGYVDSDDYVDPEMFEKLYNSALENDADIAICGNYVVSEEYNILKTELLSFDLNKNNIKDNPYILFDKNAVWNKIYKKKLIDKTKTSFRDGKWYEDMDFTTKLLMEAKKVSFVNEPLYYYLLRSGSIMNNKNVLRNLEIIETFEEIVNNVDNEKYHNELEYLAILHVLVPSIVRVLIANTEDSKKVSDELRSYVFTNYPDLEKNKYLQNNKKFKLLVFLIKHRMYSIIRLIFKVKGN